jgi:hypothetical protein
MTFRHFISGAESGQNHNLKTKNEDGKTIHYHSKQTPDLIFYFIAD